MAKVISVHEYELRPEADAKEFEAAIQRAAESGMLELPGLIGFHFLRGMRGARLGEYAAIWVYESREAWEQLWGPAGQPSDWQTFPESWKSWERDVLAPFLRQDPHEISYTSYDVL